MYDEGVGPEVRRETDRWDMSRKSTSDWLRKESSRKGLERSGSVRFHETRTERTVGIRGGIVSCFIIRIVP